MEAGGEGQGRGEASIAGEIDKASWWRSEQHHVLHQYTHGIETRTTRGGFTLRSGILQVAWLVSEANAYTALTITPVESLTKSIAVVRMRKGERLTLTRR